MSRIKLLCRDDFDLLSGDDGLRFPVLSIGGTGIVSVVANIVPKETAEMVSEFRKEILKRPGNTLSFASSGQTLFLETNPIPIKTAMGILGMCEPDLRLPLSAMLPEN